MGKLIGPSSTPDQQITASGSEVVQRQHLQHLQVILQQQQSRNGPADDMQDLVGKRYGSQNKVKVQDTACFLS